MNRIPRTQSHSRILLQPVYLRTAAQYKAKFWHLCPCRAETLVFGPVTLLVINFLETVHGYMIEK